MNFSYFKKGTVQISRFNMSSFDIRHLPQILWYGCSAKVFPTVEHLGRK